MAGTSESAYFVGVNRNKRSVTLDIAQPEGKAIARRLISQMRHTGGELQGRRARAYGLGYEELHAVFPRLIYCSITGFGQTGPYAARPGYDSLVQAMGGVMSLTGEPDGMPQKVGVPVGDLFAGLYGCIGILAALRHRDATGQGQQIDIGMLDAHVAWLANQGMNYLATGEDPARLGNQHPNIVPYQVFATADGAHRALDWQRSDVQAVLRSLRADALLEDERFATNAARVRQPALVTDTLAPVMRACTSWWVERLEALKIGCGPINRLSEVFADPHVVARGAVKEMAHSSGQMVKVIANPVRLSETPPDYRIAPPLLGEHTDAVLSERLGLELRRARRATRERGDLTCATIVSTTCICAARIPRQPPVSSKPCSAPR